MFGLVPQWFHELESELIITDTTYRSCQSCHPAPDRCWLMSQFVEYSLHHTFSGTWCFALWDVDWRSSIFRQATERRAHWIKDDKRKHDWAWLSCIGVGSDFWLWKRNWFDSKFRKKIQSEALYCNSMQLSCSVRSICCVCFMVLFPGHSQICPNRIGTQEHCPHLGANSHRGSDYASLNARRSSQVSWFWRYLKVWSFHPTLYWYRVFALYKCHGVIAKMILLLREATFTKALERTLTSGQLL